MKEIERECWWTRYLKELLSNVATNDHNCDDGRASMLTNHTRKAFVCARFV